MILTEAQVAHVKWLEDARGIITPDVVLMDARAETSPLHPLFEWDLDKAAHLAWLAQAREIIRTVKVVIVTTDITVKTPYYVRDPDLGKEQGYMSVEALRRDVPHAREAVRNELTRAAGCLRRAQGVAIAVGLGEQVDMLVAQLLGLQRHLEETEAPTESHPS